MRPSGERIGQRVTASDGPTATPSRNTGVGAGGNSRRWATITTRAVATIGTRRSAMRTSGGRSGARAADGASGAGTPACEAPSWIQRSWRLTSCAVWIRSSGSLARHA